MASLSALTNIWDNVKEIDLQPLRREALSGVRLTIIGVSGSGRHKLAGMMRLDPVHEDMATEAPIQILDLSEADQASKADLVVLLVDSRKTDFTHEAELSRLWAGANKPLLVCINRFEDDDTALVIKAWVNWKSRRVVDGSILDIQFLTGQFASAVIDLLPGKHLALGRYFPLFRVPVAHHLINDTCLTNTAYSFSTGIAEIIPVLNIPLTVTDMFVLSKNQAFLVYKLGLALGLSTRWQDYVAEFGGVLGSGFMWRQLARSLVSLVPLWGILPKVSVTYAGTYVVGQVVLQWYLTGRHLSREQIRLLYSRALTRGKELGRNLMHRMPRLRLPRLKLPRLPSLRLPRPGLPRLGLPRPRLIRTKRRQLPAPADMLACPQCGRSNAPDASYCQYCGKKLSPIEYRQPL
jgi:uncharacterized protein (DUF697 family)